jgi:glycosyltransferase involved in cell wall biosynthesis
MGFLFYITLSLIIKVLVFFKIDFYFKRFGIFLGNLFNFRFFLLLKSFYFVQKMYYSRFLIILKDYNPFLFKDWIDFVFLKLLVLVHLKVGNKYLSDRYYYSLKLIYGSIPNRSFKENYLKHYLNKFLQPYEYTLDDLSEIMLSLFYFSYINEAYLIYNYLIFQNYSINNDVKDLFDFYTFDNKITINDFLKICKSKVLVSLTISNYSEFGFSLIIIRILNQIFNDCRFLVRINDKKIYNDFKSEKSISGIDKKISLLQYDYNKTLEEIERIILSDYSFDENFILIISGSILKHLYKNFKLYKNMHILYRSFNSLVDNSFHILLYGSFAKLYEFNYGKNLNRIQIYEFSIVIPIRNSIQYFQDTLQTCLNQDYKKPFEILIIDNSDNLTLEIKSIISKMRNGFGKINFIKTPKVLELSKVFEFAYLNSKGKYILSMGSDDGILPNGLSFLDKITRANPDVDVFSWELINYFWPSYPETKLSNKLKLITINMKIIHEPIINSINYKIMSNMSYMQNPNLYLNTCVKHSYIDKIISITGKFGDGPSQDIYTGLLFNLTNSKMMKLNLSIIIAGNSNVGVGVVSTLKRNNINGVYSNFFKFLKTFRILNFSVPRYEKLNIFTDLGEFHHLFKEAVKVNYYLKLLNYQSIKLPNKTKLMKNIYSELGLNLCSDTYLKRIIFKTIINTNFFMIYYFILSYVFLIKGSLNKLFIHNIKRREKVNNNTIDLTERNKSGILNAIDLIMIHYEMKKNE